MADWAGAYGAAGAVDYLKDMVAERLLAQKQAEIERAAKAAEVEQISQRNQQANQFNQGQVAAQERFTGERDDRYQNRLQDVKFNDLRILDKEKDRATEKELRDIDAKARETARKEDQAWQAKEHEMNRALTREEGAATRGAMNARAHEAAQERANRPLSADQELKWVDSMSNKYLSNTKGARESLRNYGLMSDSLKVINASRPGMPGYGTAEQGIVNGFNKILDSTSVVREGEYDRTKNGLSLLAKMEAFKQGLTQGGTIPPGELRAMADLSRQWAEQAKNFADEQKALTTKRAVAYGLRPDLIFLDDDEAAASHKGLPDAASAAAAPPAKLGRVLPGFGK